MKPQQLMSATEVARLLGVDRSTIVRRAQAGTLTPIAKIAGATGAYLFDGETIRKMADRAGRENTTDQAPQTEPPK